MFEKIERTNKIIKDAVGEAPDVIRPPHGFRDSAVMNVIQKCNPELLRQGYKFVTVDQILARSEERNVDCGRTGQSR